MDDAELVTRLRAGDEDAFRFLVERYHSSLLRLAQTMVPSRAVAEEVVQDTWLGLLRGIKGFEGRSSLRTWLFHVLVNRARSTGAHERRPTTGTTAGSTVDPSRFGPQGNWADPPVPWPEEVDDRLVARQLADRIRPRIGELPELQRQVVTLRDLEGLSAPEVCSLLDISEGNQRVLLHRARARLRSMLENEMGKV
ncbi:MAG TPA: RNA polymerase sigma factor [Acidimicrobiales bacterium]|nr:RNA polymerase sigma factor [Acidimicrobiales bacterium]